jgi:hypothetical protein
MARRFAFSSAFTSSGRWRASARLRR